MAFGCFTIFHSQPRHEIAYGSQYSNPLFSSRNLYQAALYSLLGLEQMISKQTARSIVQSGHWNFGTDGVRFSSRGQFLTSVSRVV